MDFVDSGHDLIVAADSNASDLIREIAVECGVDFDEVLANNLILLAELIFCAWFSSSVVVVLQSCAILWSCNLLSCCYLCAYFDIFISNDRDANPK